MADKMTLKQKLLADLMLLQKIDRNLLSLSDNVAIRFGRAVRAKILQAHDCKTSAECTAKLYREMEKFR